MAFIADTCIWSLAMRRRRKDLSRQERAIVLQLRDAVVEGDVVLLGVVRQELLSGLKTRAAFDSAREHLSAMDDFPPDVGDYEQAGWFRFICRDEGIAASGTDMLICAFAANRDLPILTTDQDFRRYAGFLPIELMPLPTG